MLSLFALVLLAQGAGTPPVKPALNTPPVSAADRDSPEQLSDGFAMGLSIVAGGLAGTFAGCKGLPGSGCDGFDAINGFAGGLLGLSLGGVIYHHASDGDGSGGAAILGTIGGLVVGTATTRVTDDKWVMGSGLLLTAALGGGLAYGLVENDLKPIVGMVPGDAGGLNAQFGLSGSF